MIHSGSEDPGTESSRASSVEEPPAAAAADKGCGRGRGRGKGAGPGRGAGHGGGAGAGVGVAGLGAGSCAAHAVRERRCTVERQGRTPNPVISNAAGKAATCLPSNPKASVPFVRAREKLNHFLAGGVGILSLPW